MRLDSWVLVLAVLCALLVGGAVVYVACCLRK
jgi:hypothetical protein